jgi:hypothetical protein
VWARFLNTEFKKGANFTADQADVWIMGFKVEGPTTSFYARNGGQIEILGGVANQFGRPWPSDNPILKAGPQGRMVATFVTSGSRSGDRGFDYAFRMDDPENPQEVMTDSLRVRPRKNRRKDSDHFFIHFVW